MSDAVNEVEGGGGSDMEGPPLTEREYAETHMTYGHGRFPWIVAVVWIVALSGFTWYMVKFGLADYRRWGAG
jgi:hypothetical protein